MRLIDADNLREIENAWYEDLRFIILTGRYDETDLAKIDVLEEVLHDIDTAPTLSAKGDAEND